MIPLSHSWNEHTKGKTFLQSHTVAALKKFTDSKHGAMADAHRLAANGRINISCMRVIWGRAPELLEKLFVISWGDRETDIVQKVGDTVSHEGSRM